MNTLGLVYISAEPRCGDCAHLLPKGCSSNKKYCDFCLQVHKWAYLQKITRLAKLGVLAH